MPNVRHSPVHPSLVLATLIPCLLVTAPAQDTPALLLGNRWYDARTLEPGATLTALDDLRPRVEPDGTVHFGDGLVDPARRLVLTAPGEDLRLLRSPDQELWHIPLSDLHLAPPVQLARAQLTRDCVLVPDQEDDLVAISLADGKVRWRDGGGEHGELVHDDELMACFVTTAEGRTVRVLSLANGARACSIQAPDGAEFLCLAPHGLVVGGPTGATLHARTGPRLFAVPGEVHAGIGDTHGFCLHVGQELVALDPAGKERWRRPLAEQWPNTTRLTATASGLVLVTQFQPNADLGASVTAHEPATGEVAWRRTLPELGVDHSKYWQDVTTCVRGETIVVTCHAAGGHWLAVLDQHGEVTGRIEAKSK